jgi:hypothetical protein
MKPVVDMRFCRGVFWAAPFCIVFWLLVVELVMVWWTW